MGITSIFHPGHIRPFAGISIKALYKGSDPFAVKFY